MKKYLAAAAVAAAMTSTPAMALSLVFQNGDSAAFSQPINNGVTVTDFGPGGGNPGAYGGPGTFTGAGSGVYTSELTSGIAAQPNFGSTGGFAAVLSGGSFTINFAAAQVFSFVLGSLDAGNSLELVFSAGPNQVFAGPVLNGGALENGNQTVGTQNGRVIFDAQGGPAIVGAIFRSSVNSMEFDNIVTAVPEPATWGMMILGFGLVGWQLRSNRRSTKVSYA